MAGGVNHNPLAARLFPQERTFWDKLADYGKGTWSVFETLWGATNTVDDSIGQYTTGLVKGVAKPFMEFGNHPLFAQNPETGEVTLNPAMIENNFDLASAVTLGAGAVPARGNELRMGIRAFHGTGRQFDEFSHNAPKVTGGGLNDRTFSFSTNPKVASRYAEQFGADGAPNVRMHDLDVKNPLVLKPADHERLQQIVYDMRAGKEIGEVKAIFLEDALAEHGVKWAPGQDPVAAIREAGYDALIRPAGRFGAEQEVQVFDPTQVRDWWADQGPGV